MKKASFLLSITLFATSYSHLSSQSGSLTEISKSSSEGITFGTMHSAFKKDVRFENGVDMVVEAAVELLDSTVYGAHAKGLNALNFFDPVLLGVEESIKTRSKEVGLSKKEEDILYRAVMDALQKRIDFIIADLDLQQTKTIPEPQPPYVSTNFPPVGVEPVRPKDVEPPKPAENTGPKPTGIPTPPQSNERGFLSGQYYLSTFINVGSSDEGSFQNGAAASKIDPSTTWGYGLAVGVARPDNTRVELEASYRGSDAKTNTNAAGGFDISYYSLMANVYRDFEVGSGSNIDAFVGVGLGISIANLSGSVNNYGVFGHVPETGEATLAYQMMIGAKYNYTPDLALYMAYRLFNTEDFNHFNPDPIHMFEIGLRKDL